MELYGTIGPACEDTEILTDMFRAGMTGIRLNASHSSLEEAEIWLEHICSAAEKAGVCPGLLIDLQGPELRTGKWTGEFLLKEGEEIYLGRTADARTVPVPDILFSCVDSGQEILLDDGKILLKALCRKDGKILCAILRGGTLRQGKSIALPGIEVDSPTLTEEDEKNLLCAGRYGVTGVMLPFVRGMKDLDCLRDRLKEAGQEKIKIYAKIENQAGIRALDEIIDGSDVVVIARGDLGNAMPLWELPKVQKMIAERCRQKKRKFMVVTQMLASMEHAKVPTRAEVSDIYNAVLDGASSVMLTGETAVGEYPVEAMEYLVKTVKAAE